jgi:hypothetical protein
MDSARSREGVISPSNSVGGVQRTWRAHARRSRADIPEGPRANTTGPEYITSTRFDVASPQMEAGTREAHLMRGHMCDGRRPPENGDDRTARADDSSDTGAPGQRHDSTKLPACEARR